MPGVSVIIPVYRSADTVVEALESVLNQSALAGAVQSVDAEVLLMDDASPDSSGEVIDAALRRNGYVLDEERVHGSKSIERLQWYVRSSAPGLRVCYGYDSNNGGPARARNRGIALAQHSWVAFLDSDDAWLPGRIETQLALAKDHDDVAMWCGETVGMEAGDRQAEIGGQVSDTDVRGEGSAPPQPSAFSPQPSLQELTLSDLVIENPVATSTVLIKRSVLDAVGGFDEQFRGPEDYDLWLRIAAKGRMMKIEMPLSKYRCVPGSLSRDERTFLPEVLKVIDKAFGEDGVLRGRPAFENEARSSQYWSASWMAFCNGRRWRAINLWWLAYRLNRRSGSSVQRRWWPLLVRYVCGTKAVD